jgi:hypothetical protein
VKNDASARQSEMNRAMPHELNTKCADETFPYVETRNAWQFSNKAGLAKEISPKTLISATFERG